MEESCPGLFLAHSSCHSASGFAFWQPSALLLNRLPRNCLKSNMLKESLPACGNTTSHPLPEGYWEPGCCCQTLYSQLHTSGDGALLVSQGWPWSHGPQWWAGSCHHTKLPASLLLPESSRGQRWYSGDREEVRAATNTRTPPTLPAVWHTASATCTQHGPTTPTPPAHLMPKLWWHLMVRRGAPLQPHLAVQLCREGLHQHVLQKGRPCQSTSWWEGEDVGRDRGPKQAPAATQQQAEGFTSPSPLRHRAMWRSTLWGRGRDPFVTHQESCSSKGTAGWQLAYKIGGFTFTWDLQQDKRMLLFFTWRKKNHVHPLSSGMQDNLWDHPGLASLACQGWGSAVTAKKQLAHSPAPIPAVLQPLPWLHCKGLHQHVPSI